MDLKNKALSLLNKLTESKYLRLAEEKVIETLNKLEAVEETTEEGGDPDEETI